MAEFCTCGSIIINDHCTNKNCSFKSGSTSEKPSKVRKVAKAAKGTRTRKSSKCITYNLYDVKEEENVN